MLGLVVVVVTGAFLFVADRVTGGKGTTGLAAASTAGNAAAVPAIVASANPAYQPAAAQATLLVATSVVVTAVCVPFLTAWWARRVGVPDATASHAATLAESGATTDPAAPGGRAEGALAADGQRA